MHRTYIFFIFAALAVNNPSLAMAKTKVVSVSTGVSCSQERLNYCATTHPDYDMRPGWILNHCSRSPVGPRFEYLMPAWNCLRD